MSVRAGLLAAVAATLLVPPGTLGAQQDPAPPTPAGGRRWIVPIPAGCDAPPLPDVVFVGTLAETGTPAGAPQEIEYETARFRLDQARAGDLARYTYNGLIDVRYGLDAKDLERGQQYLVGAQLDPVSGALTSTIRPPEAFFGGDDVIAASERDVTCPAISDPIRTTYVDGRPVDASVAGPFLAARGRLLRALLLPLGVAFAVLLGLATVRWVLTGIGKGVGSFVRTASEPREVRAAMRSRPGLSRDLEDAGRR